MISIKSSREIQLMRQTCRLAAKTLKFLGQNIKVGMTTEDINQLCHQYIINRKAYPAPLNYHGFPKSVCTSLNDVICHGIPSKKDVIKDGDILNIDVTTKLEGFFGDTNKTYLIGNVSEEIKRLVSITQYALDEAIKICRPGAFLGDIGATIEEIVLDHGYSVVQEYCGHGIGREFHEDPQVLHYGKRKTGVELRPGMTFTIEPMVNLGKRHCRVLNDGWTVVTKDGSISAQFEHTILITEDSYEVLTQLTDDDWSEADARL